MKNIPRPVIIVLLFFIPANLVYFIQYITTLPDLSGLFAGLFCIYYYLYLSLHKQIINKEMVKCPYDPTIVCVRKTMNCSECAMQWEEH